MTKWHGGKGSGRRPEDRTKIDNNWDRIFGKKTQPDQAKSAQKSTQNKNSK